MHFFFFFYRRYNPLWVLAFSVILLHSVLSFLIYVASVRKVQFQSLSSSQRSFFSGTGLSALRTTLNLEDQGIPFCLGHHP